MLILSGAFQYVHWSLFLLRLMVALVFAASGLSHLKSPKNARNPLVSAWVSPFSLERLNWPEPSASRWAS